MTIVVVLAIVTAAATAVRSTWSPCGLSMLSTVTPMAESGRGRRWSVTAAWFVAGAVLGGLTLGALMAGLAALVGAFGLSSSAALTVAAVAALLCAASDLDPFGIHIPFHGRQVNERWLDQYRAWVYGGGFGWQIGVGLATYITTAGIYLTIVLAALTGNPVVAVALGTAFGLARGLAIFAGRNITSTDRLLAVHRRFDALRAPGTPRHDRRAVRGGCRGRRCGRGRGRGRVRLAVVVAVVVAVARLGHRAQPAVERSGEGASPLEPAMGGAG